MSKTVAVTARISLRDKEMPGKPTTLTGRTKAFPIARAVEEYLENQAWPIEEIQRAVEEAEAGDFAGEKDVDAFFAE